MPAGLQIIGQHGITQVDENFSNYGFVAKGNIPLSTFNSPTSSSITVSAAAPMLFIRCSGGIAGILSVVSDPYAAPTTMRTVTYYFHNTDPNATWYLFDKLDTLSDVGSYGLKVYNASGKLTFNSNVPTLRIAGAAPIPAGIFEAGAIDTGVPGVYAVATSVSRSGWFNPPFGSPVFLVDGVQTTSTGASAFMGEFVFTNNFRSQLNYLQSGNMLLANVQGY